MKKKKLFYRSVAGLLLSTVLATGTPIASLPGLKSLPIISDISITAQAAANCYTIENGVLTLQNKVKASTIKELNNKDQITKIVAAEGTIMPENCTELFFRFSNCTSIDLSKADTSKVKNMKNMFHYLQNLEYLNISGFNTSNVTDMYGMFSDCKKLTKIDVSSFDTSKVTDMAYMFYSCNALTELNLSNFNTKKVTRMTGMFRNCMNITKLDLRSFNTSNVTDMSSLFTSMHNLTDLDISSFNTSNVTKMTGMFSSCSSLKTLDLHHFNTAKVVSMGEMFAYSKSLTGLDLSSFKTSKVESMSYMFAGCKFKELDLSNFNATNASKTDMFSLSNISIITLGPNFKKIPEKAGLDNGTCGWAKGSPKSERISGDGEYAVITNSGTNTYYKIVNFENGTIEMKCGDYPYSQTYPQYQARLDVFFSLGDITPFIPKYTWYRDKNVITNATGSSYVCTKEDIGKYITCTVTDEKGIYDGELKVTTSIAIRKAPGPASPKDLKVYDCNIKGASDGKITGVDTTMEYTDWDDFDFVHAKPCTSNTISNLKAGYYRIRYKETDTHDPSGATQVTIKDGKEQITGTVTIEGTAQYGKTLTAKITNSNVTNFKYEWVRNGSIISSANTSTYKLTKADIGKTIYCVVSDADGNYAGYLESKSTAKITKADGPAAPTGLKAVAVTKKGASDGKITGVKTTMEYSTKSDFSANVVACTSTKITGLKAGTYYVRIKETETTYAGKATTVKIVTSTPVENDVTKIFKDVKKGEWYVSAIQYVYDKKYMNGTGKTTFSPLMNITRGQFVTVLYNVAGTPAVKFDAKKFKDVKSSDFYALPVIWAANNNITSGIAKNQFGPNENISREQMAVMLYNFAQYKKIKITSKSNALDNFYDKKNVSDWASEALKWAVTNGIINGKGKYKNTNKDILDPKGTATRAECAQMIMNFMKKYENKN